MRFKNSMFLSVPSIKLRMHRTLGKTKQKTQKVSSMLAKSDSSKQKQQLCKLTKICICRLKINARKLAENHRFRKWYTQCFCMIHSQRSNSTDNRLFNLQEFINEISSPRKFCIIINFIISFILESSNKLLN